MGEKSYVTHCLYCGRVKVTLEDGKEQWVKEDIKERISRSSGHCPMCYEISNFQQYTLRHRIENVNVLVFKKFINIARRLKLDFDRITEIVTRIARRFHAIDPYERSGFILPYMAERCMEVCQEMGPEYERECLALQKMAKYIWDKIGQHDEEKIAGMITPPSKEKEEAEEKTA